MNNYPSSRQVARAQGLTKYFTGTPCKRGHVALRKVSDCACVECDVIKAARWRAANPEKVRFSSSRWSKNHPEKQREYSKKRRAANPEYHKYYVNKWRRANPDKYKARIDKWRFKNKKRINAYSKRRRAFEKGAEGSFSYDDIQLIFKFQHGECCGCKRLFCNELQPTVDHVQPISRGGSNWPSNLQLLCQPCNDSKGARTMEEWEAVYA